MFAQEKITGRQLGILLFTMIATAELLTVPSVTVKWAKQDAWMSLLPSSITAIVSILGLTALAHRYPGMTIMEYSSRILGKWLGKLLGLYLAFDLFILVSFTRLHSNFMDTVALPKTPTWVESAVLLVVSGYAVYLGIEVLGRCVEFLIPFGILAYLVLLFLSLPDMDVGNLRPILENGWAPVLKASIIPSGWMSEIYALGFLLPFLNRQDVGRKVSFLAVAAIVLAMTAVILQSILVFGNLTSRLAYAYFDVIRYIDIADFLQRMDPFIESGWIYLIALKEAVHLLTFCICVSQLCGIENYRAVIVPLTLLSIFGSEILYRNTAEATNYLLFAFPLDGFVLSIIPLVLLVVDSIRRRKEMVHEK